MPELCHHIAEAWVSAAVLASSVQQYKQHNPGKVRTAYTQQEEEQNSYINMCHIICIWYGNTSFIFNVFNAKSQVFVIFAIVLV